MQNLKEWRPRQTSALLANGGSEQSYRKLTLSSNINGTQNATKFYRSAYTLTLHLGVIIVIRLLSFMQLQYYYFTLYIIIIIFSTVT